MRKRQAFESEEIGAIEAARKKNKDKRVETRLKALELRARGVPAKEVAKATGFFRSYFFHYWACLDF